MKLSGQHPRHPLAARLRHRGAILVVALIVTVTLTGMVLMLGQEMRVESISAGNRAASAQADAIARGAEQYVLAVLADQGEDVGELAEDQFSAIQVGDGYFWVLRPQYDDGQMPAFGLMSENAKLNLNSATHDQLIMLPGMTEDVADAIIDWHDSNDTPRTNGAESQYYQELPDGYQAKNSNFETVEELLLVKNVTRDLLYGIPGPAQPLGTRSSSIQSSGSGVLTDPQIARGVYDLFTVKSAEPAPSPARINITSNRQRSQLQTMLTQQLSAGRASSIIALMQGKNFRSAFDFYFQCRLTRDEFDKIFSRISTSSSTAAPAGRINVCEAPRSVLLSLTGLDATAADKVVAARDSSWPTAGTIGWFADAIGATAAAKLSGDQIASHTYQWSADILAVSGNGRSFKRIRIVIDNSSGTPQIVYRRDITDRGWPMDTQILASLRAGQGLGSYAPANIMSMGGPRG